MDQRWNVLLGAVLIVLGAVWAGWLKIPMPWFSVRGQRNLSMKIGHMISKFNVYSDWQRFSFVV